MLCFFLYFFLTTDEEIVNYLIDVLLISLILSALKFSISLNSFHTNFFSNNAYILKRSDNEITHKKLYWGGGRGFYNETSNLETNCQQAMKCS